MKYSAEELQIYRRARWWLLLTAIVVGAMSALTYGVEGLNLLSAAGMIVATACAGMAVHAFTITRKHRGYWRALSVAVVLLVAGVSGTTSEPASPAQAHECYGDIYQSYACRQTHNWQTQMYWYWNMKYLYCTAGEAQSDLWCYFVYGTKAQQYAPPHGPYL